jgi:hypothetical protein
MTIRMFVLNDNPMSLLQVKAQRGGARTQLFK